MTIGDIFKSDSGGLGGADDIPSIGKIINSSNESIGGNRGVGGGGGRGSVDKELNAAASEIERNFRHYGSRYGFNGYYPQNPYATDLFLENMQYPGPYNNVNNHGFGLKYGTAGPSAYGEPSHHYGGYGGYGGDGYGNAYAGTQQHYGTYGGGGHSGMGYGSGGGHGGTSVHSNDHYAEPIIHHHHSSSASSSGGHHSGTHRSHKSSKAGSATSALTLLAFLFFLNILQSCLKEHMMTMNPTVMVMTAGTGRRQAISMKNNPYDDTLNPDEELSMTSKVYEDMDPDKVTNDYTIFTPEDKTTMIGSSPNLHWHGRSLNNTVQTKLININSGSLKPT